MRTSIVITCAFLALSLLQTETHANDDGLIHGMSPAAKVVEPGYSPDAERVDVTVYRRRPPEARATNVPPDILSLRQRDPEVFARQLSAYLTDGVQDPFLRIKTLHDWITLNIEYDVDALFLDHYYPSQHFRDVLTRGTAVCSGYANLLHALVSHTDIPSYVIPGYGRGYQSSALQPVVPHEPNHEWNAVHIDGVWYLVDSTWNAGGLAGDRFEHRYSTAYLFLEPEHMIFTHFPINASHQLLANPVSAQSFAALPLYRGAFFSHGFRPFEGLTENASVDNEFTIEFPVPEDEVVLRALLIDTNGVPHEYRTIARTNDGKGRLQALFPRAGQWVVRLIALDSGAEQGEWMADLSVVSQTGTPNEFPQLYLPFYRDNIELIAPEHGPLHYGDEVTIELRMPGYHDVFVGGRNSGTWLDRVDSTDIFRATLTVSESDDVWVSGRRSPGLDFEGILGFRVVSE